MSADAPPMVLWSTSELATAIASLPAAGPLPCRTVLVPREAVAHAMRRELLRGPHPHALAGTRFITPTVAAAAVLDAAGLGYRAGEEALRPARLRALFESGLPLAHFDLGLLRSRPGWDEAFAHAMRSPGPARASPERRQH